MPVPARLGLSVMLARLTSASVGLLEPKLADCLDIFRARRLSAFSCELALSSTSPHSLGFSKVSCNTSSSSSSESSWSSDPAPAPSSNSCSSESESDSSSRTWYFPFLPLPFRFGAFPFGFAGPLLFLFSSGQCLVPRTQPVPVQKVATH